LMILLQVQMGVHPGQFEQTLSFYPWQFW
jgi:hypothetical protein